MRHQATNLIIARSIFLPAAGLLCLSLSGPIACKEKSQTPSNQGAVAEQEPLETPGGQTEAHPDDAPSIFDEPDPFKMPDPRDVVGLEWDVPDGWEAYDDLRAFRVSTWRVPGDNEGIFAIAFYRGPSMQGAVDSNVSRWARQVRNYDGSTPEPMISTRRSGPLTITTVRIDGDIVPGVTQTDLELGATGSSLVGVVVSGGPVGDVYFRLSGPKMRIDELLPAFTDLIDSIRPIEGFKAP